MGPKAIANALVEASSTYAVATSLERAIADVLIEAGASQLDAPVEAERIRSQVANALHQYPSTSLPFDLVADNRIVGKSRARPGDSPDVALIRDRLRLVDELREAAYAIGSDAFEHLAAALLGAGGASTMTVTAKSGEGGIDAYGRLPIRLADPNIPKTLIGSVLLEKDLLVLVQAKCYSPSKSLDRPEVDKFAMQAASCIDQYGGNPHPPSRHVPFGAYQKGEAALKIIVTTASVTDGAKGAARQYDIQIVDGRRLAELLTYHGRGFIEADGEQHVSVEALRDWAVNQAPTDEPQSP